jgi:hypothetical protein
MIEGRSLVAARDREAIKEETRAAMSRIRIHQSGAERTRRMGFTAAS